MKLETNYHKIQTVIRTYKFVTWTDAKKALSKFKSLARAKEVGSLSVNLEDLGKEQYEITVEYVIIR